MSNVNRLKLATLNAAVVATLNEDNGVFFADQLKYLEKEIYRVEYAELLGKQLFDVDSSIPAGYKSGSYRSFDIRGRAAWINGGAGDIPRVGADSKETTYPIKTVADSFGFDVLEIEAARVAGINLETEMANAAAYVVEVELDDAIFNGVSDLGITGFLNAPDVISEQAANNAGATSRTFANKTPDEILADIHGLFTRQAVDSKQREKARKLLLPTTQYNDIATRRLGSTSDTTVLEYVVGKSVFLSSMSDVVSVPHLAGAGAGGTDLMAIYDPNPVKIQTKLPLDTTILSNLAQVDGLEIVTPVIARFGGVVVRFPLSVRMLYGI